MEATAPNLTRPARIRYLTHLEGGRITPAVSGIRPHFGAFGIRTSCLVTNPNGWEQFPTDRYTAADITLYFTHNAAQFSVAHEFGLYEGNRLTAVGEFSDGQGIPGHPVLRPLGILAPHGNDHTWPSHPLEPHIDTIDPALIGSVTAYLEASPCVLAWMGYSEDIIRTRYIGKRRHNQHFGVSGGPAICSDGTYYWRYDATNYIRTYGIGIPEVAIEHMEANNWQPPTFTNDQLLRLDRELAQIIPTG